MPKQTIVYWRDIPAQVIVRERRVSAKRELSKRFIEAIDMCAMRVGARDSDAYLAEWRKGEATSVDGDMEEAAQAAADKIEEEYDRERLKALIANQGRDAAAS
ncbi:MAG: virulence factor [Pseudomonadota bacterium]